MIRVYDLQSTIIEGVDTVACIDLIHDALLQITETPGVRRLIMYTSNEEHDALQAVALQVREPTQAELELYNGTVTIFVKDSDTLRIEELLHQSPPVITQPEMWEAIRIIARRLGYSF